MAKGIKLPFGFPATIPQLMTVWIGSAQFTVGTQFSGKTFKGQITDSLGYNGSFFKDPVTNQFVPEWSEWNNVNNTGGLILTPEYSDLSPAVIGNKPNPNYLGNIITHKSGNSFDLAKNLVWYENTKPIAQIDPNGKLFGIDPITRALIIKRNRWEDNIIDGITFPKIDANNITYTLKFKYLDPVKASYVKDYIGTDIEIIYTATFKQDGESADYIVIQPKTSQIFNNALASDTLELNALVYLEGSKVTSTDKITGISWEYYDPQHTVDEGWVKLPIVPGSNCDYFKLIVSAGDIPKSRSYRYSAILDGIRRQDTIVIRKETSEPRLKITSTAGDKYKSSELGNVSKKLTAEVTLNIRGKWSVISPTDPILSNYTFKWKLYDEYATEIISSNWPKVGKGLSEISVYKNEITNFNTIILELSEEYSNKMWYGVTRKISQASPDLARIGLEEYHRTLPLHSAIKPCIANSDGSINYWLDPNDITKKFTGEPSDLTGKDGQVCVCFPDTYSIIHGKGISDNSDNDITAIGYAPFSVNGDIAKFFPSFLVSMDLVTRNKTNNSLVAVFNDTQNFAGSGGVGTPICGLSNNEFITSSKALGSSWLPSFYYAEQIITAFMNIEYATYNLKQPINKIKTPEGFTQGGIGTGATNWTSSQWETFNGKAPIIKLGEVQKHLSAVGNTQGTGELQKTFTVNAQQIITKFNAWRWLSNPWGYIQKACVGALVKSTLINEPLKFYMTKSPGKITPNTPLINYDFIGNLPKQSGFISEVYPGTSMPININGSSSTKTCGYWKVDATENKENRLTLVGNGLDTGEFSTRNTTDVRLDFLIPYTEGNETIGTYATGLFTLLKQ